MVSTPSTCLTRRAMLVGGASALCVAAIDPAQAQGGLSEGQMRDLLLHGSGPRPAPSPYPGPDPVGPQRPPRPHGGGYGPPPGYGSTLPGSVQAQQDDTVVVVVIDRRRSIDFHIQFALNSAELDYRAQRELSVLGRVLQSPDLLPSSFLVAGHTDVSGGYDHNMRLSMWRAVSVRRHLIRVHDVAPRRLYAAGYGPTALRTPGRPRHPINRRVEIVAVTGTN